MFLTPNSFLLLLRERFLSEMTFTHVECVEVKVWRNV